MKTTINLPLKTTIEMEPQIWKAVNNKKLSEALMPLDLKYGSNAIDGWECVPIPEFVKVLFWVLVGGAVIAVGAKAWLSAAPVVLHWWGSR